MASKKSIISGLIKAYKPVFDAYPDLKALPVYAWGRYYKYECAGDPFEQTIEEGLKYCEPEYDLQWDLIDKIDKKHNKTGGELYNGKWGNYSPLREDAVRIYDFDEGGGKCLIIVKEDNKFTVEDVDCDSPE
jgi:hypothetical protein